MGWLPSAPQLSPNPLHLTAQAEAAGKDPVAHAVEQLKSGDLRFSCEQPDDPQNFPRNLFIWRSNLLGSSGKGHEYMLKYLLGTQNAVLNRATILAAGARQAGRGRLGRKTRLEGKLDLVTTLDFRMSTTCLYSDIVLPTATWYEKDDLNTSDMHPFIHPLSAAVDPAWEAKSDWEIYKAIAKKFSEVGGPTWAKRRDLVLTPLLARLRRRTGAAAGCEGLEEGRVRPDPGQDRAEHDRGRA